MKTAKRTPPATGRNQPGEVPLWTANTLTTRAPYAAQPRSACSEDPGLVVLDAEGEQAVVGDRQADQDGEETGGAVRRPDPAGGGGAELPVHPQAAEELAEQQDEDDQAQRGLHLHDRVEAEVHRLRAAGVAAVVDAEQHGDGGAEGQGQQRDPPAAARARPRCVCATLR